MPGSDAICFQSCVKGCFAEKRAYEQKVIYNNFYANCLNASVAVNSRQTTTKTLIRGD
jgi:hypothetical protein